MLTHLALFTGINGFGIAADWAGFETIGFSEIDPYCSKLLAQKWPNIKNYGDIRITPNFEPLRGRVTVLSAGVPCQKSSVAGTRLGPDELWETACDVIGLIEPDWIIFENTPNILTFFSFKKVLLRLDSLLYEVRAFDVPAEAVGADFLGYRTFIVATSDRIGTGWRRAADKEKERRRPSREVAGSTMGSPNSKGLAQRQSEQGNNGEKQPTAIRTSWPEFDPELLRAIHGIRNRRDRIKALGNSVVPAQVYPFFETIAQVETGE